MNYKNYYIKDYGKNPVVLPVCRFTNENDTYRTSLWTGEYLQSTLMSIDVGKDVGAEVHPDTDQILLIVSGHALVREGASANELTVNQYAESCDAVFVPAGTYHNLINAGKTPLKLFSIYAPPHHPFGTVEKYNQE